MEQFSILYTIHYYEKIGEEYVMKHYNGLMFANSFAQAAGILEEDNPDAERIDMQIFDSCIIIPDDKMDMIREILKQ